MRVVQTESFGSAPFVGLAVSLVNYAQASDPGNWGALVELCQRLWPNADIYRGNTHLRVSVSSSSSFYVDLSGERKAP